MAFQLTIAAGKEAGREFSFEQAQVVIGRTDECDIILYDSGISRRHARIFAEGHTWVVEDLGSSNGTKVNGASVKRQVLNDGDALTMGPVTFNFKSLNAPLTGDISELAPDDPATRIIDLSLLPKSRNKGVAMVPTDVNREDLRSMGRASTAMMPRVRASSPGLPRVRPSSGGSPAVRGSNSGAPAVKPLDVAPEPITNTSDLPKGVAAPPANLQPRPSRVGARAIQPIDDSEPVTNSSKGPPPEPPTNPQQRPSRTAARALNASNDAEPRTQPEGPPASALALGDGEEPRTRMTGIPAPKMSNLSAAERIRLRRDAGVGGKLKIWWSETTPGVRKAVKAFGVMLFLGVVGGVSYSQLHEADKKPKKKEPTELSGEPLATSFGLGPQAVFERADEKAFTFDLSTPVEAMVILHYQCKDISDREVVVSVNGVEMGWLPADTLVSDDIEHELLVPSRSVKRNQQNTVVFDNVNNPPGAEPWLIWNVWAEIVVLPELDEAALIVDANAKLKRGIEMWDHRTIGASNTWNAYKNFREAWLWLEALPAVNRPTSYEMAMLKMREASKALDEQCTELLRQARTAKNFKKFEQANSVLDHVADVFPSKAHPCQARAEAERAELEL